MSQRKVRLTLIIFLSLFLVIVIRMYYLQNVRERRFDYWYPKIRWKISIDKNIQGMSKEILEEYKRKHTEIAKSILVIASPSEATIVANAYTDKISRLEAIPILLLIIMAANIEGKALWEDYQEGDLDYVSEYFLNKRKIDKKMLSIYGKKVGMEVLDGYLKAFGVGRGGGGLLRVPNDSLSGYDLNKFGVDGGGIFLTPLQIMSVISIIANDGMHKSTKVILKGTSDILSEFLKSAVNHGGDREVRIRGYDVGGVGFAYREGPSMQSCIVGFVGFTRLGIANKKIVVCSLIEGRGNESLKMLALSKEMFRKVTIGTIKYLEKLGAEKEAEKR